MIVKLPIVRDCPECDVSFEPHRRDQKFCTRACKQRDSSRRQKARAKARRPDRPCEWCGTTIVNAPQNSRYCEAECRRLAYAERDRKRGPEDFARTCAECGKPSQSRMYCTNSCRNRAGERARQTRLHGPRRSRRCVCGKQIPPEARLDRKYCTTECKERDHGRLRKERRHADRFGGTTRNCAHCGNEIPSLANAQKKYCTKQCNVRAVQNRWKKGTSPRPRSVQRVARPDRRCEWCSKLMRSPQSTYKYCSAECRRLGYAARDRARVRERRAAELATRPCRWCNGPIVNVQKKSARFCCASCRNAATYERTKDQHKAYRDMVRSRPEFREINRGYAYRRRARQWNTQLGEITPDDLAARMSVFAGCWVCGGDWTEVEHVKPLAKGGPHVLANLRPACGDCNRRKGRRWSGVNALVEWCEQQRRTIACDRA